MLEGFVAVDEGALAGRLDDVDRLLRHEGAGLVDGAVLARAGGGDEGDVHRGAQQAGGDGQVGRHGGRGVPGVAPGGDDAADAVEEVRGVEEVAGQRQRRLRLLGARVLGIRKGNGDGLRGLPALAKPIRVVAMEAGGVLERAEVDDQDAGTDAGLGDRRLEGAAAAVRFHHQEDGLDALEVWRVAFFLPAVGARHPEDGFVVVGEGVHIRLALDDRQGAAFSRLIQPPQPVGNRRVALGPLEAVVDAVGLAELHAVVGGRQLPVRVEGGHRHAELPLAADGGELEALLEEVRRQPLGQRVAFDGDAGKIFGLPVRGKEVGQLEAERGDDLLGRAAREAVQQDGPVPVFADAQAVAGVGVGRAAGRDPGAAPGHVPEPGEDTIQRTLHSICWWVLAGHRWAPTGLEGAPPPEAVPFDAVG